MKNTGKLDPRISDPKAIFYFEPQSYEEEMDVNHLLSFVLTFVGMIFKYKWAVWVSFFMMVSTFLNIPNNGSMS